MTDEELVELAGAMGKAKEEIGRLGTLYPGEAPSSFPAEADMDEDNDSPTTEAEQDELNRRTLRELNPSHLSPEGKAWLAAAVPADRRARLKKLALERM